VLLLLLLLLLRAVCQGLGARGQPWSPIREGVAFKEVCCEVQEAPGGALNYKRLVALAEKGGMQLLGMMPWAIQPRRTWTDTVAGCPVVSTGSWQETPQTARGEEAAGKAVKAVNTGTTQKQTEITSLI
jgi:hypothetical protein